MPYRDDEETLRARIAALEIERQELAERCDALSGALRLRRAPRTRLPAFAWSIGVSAVAWTALTVGGVAVHLARDAGILINDHALYPGIILCAAGYLAFAALGTAIHEWAKGREHAVLGK